MSKAEIRKKYLALRQALSPREHLDANEKICSHFFSSVDLRSVQILHTFLPLSSKNEPNTWQIIERLKKDFPQIKISIPKVANEKLVNYYFESKDQLKKNQWGIPETLSGNPTRIDQIDLAIVPL